MVLSFAFLIRSPYWCAIKWLWIWLTVSIVTLTTISRLVPPSRKLSPACAERIRNQADQHQIGGADDRDAVEQIIEILLGRLARADAGNEAAVALQIVRRLLAVELHRGVEEAEEGDADAVERLVGGRAMLQVGADGDQPVARAAFGASRGCRPTEARSAASAAATTRRSAG